MTDDSNNNVLEFALLIPNVICADIIADAPKSKESCSFNYKSTPAKVGESVSGFDPATIAFVWLGVKVVGGAVASIATGVVSNAIYDKIKNWSQKDKIHLRLRFRTGEEFNFESNSAEELARLSETLEKHKVLM